MHVLCTWGSYGSPLGPKAAATWGQPDADSQLGPPGRTSPPHPGHCVHQCPSCQARWLDCLVPWASRCVSPVPRQGILRQNVINRETDSSFSLPLPVSPTLFRKVFLVSLKAMESFFSKLYGPWDPATVKSLHVLYQKGKRKLVILLCLIQTLACERKWRVLWLPPLESRWCWYAPPRTAGDCLLQESSAEAET